MPEGQYTGNRAVYLYTNDSGESTYLVLTDETLGSLAGTGLTAATQANAGTATPRPTRFKPRGVHWQGELGGRIVRKFIICGTTDATLYAADTPQAIAIDGVQGSTTGRRGEVLSFLSLPAGGGG